LLAAEVANSVQGLSCLDCRAKLAMAAVPVATLTHPSSQIGLTMPQPVSANESWRPLELPSTLEALRKGLQQQPGNTPNPNQGRVTVFDDPLPKNTAESCPDQHSLSNRKLEGEAIPGYLIDRSIGHGGMGTVYLARQLSLDRPVALKVMSRQWASDPLFVARFVREAYAAAQLNHPNVVQIYDIGEAYESRYFSMEYVKGYSLLALLKARGKLDVEKAAGLILQAARGLKHAHDRGIIHRDIKPENLLIDEHGVLKVADLGLVKTPDLSRQQDTLHDSDAASKSGLHTIPSDMTGVRMALGTPAYMAPEQCRDAASVDHRADIYSLGCTFYALITGTQPFQAPDSTALMKKQAYERLVPPEKLNARVPGAISRLVQKMMAKRPDERHRTMAEVIEELERFLGVSTYTAFQPTESQTDKVELMTAQFYASPTAKWRQSVVSGALSCCALAMVLLIFFGHAGYAFGLGATILQATATYFVLSSWANKSTLFRKFRTFLLGLSAGDWIVAAGALGLFGVLLWTTGFLAEWLSGGLFGIAVAVSLVFVVDRKRDLERFASVQAAEDFIKSLYRVGIATEDSQLFFAKCAGKNWEEFFEAVFGYEDKMATRSALRGNLAGGRIKFMAWREPLFTLLNHIELQRKKARERAMLEHSEFKRLMAAGYSRHEAHDRAAQTVAAIVEQASAIRDSQLMNTDNDGRLAAKLARGSHQQLEQPEPAHKSGPLDVLLNLLIGPVVRAVLAGLLLALFGWWFYTNELFSFVRPKYTADLVITGIPKEWTSWVDSMNIGWAGLLLIASLFFRGTRMASLTLLGAAITVFGHKLGIRTVEPIRDHHVALFLGTVLALVGYRLGRR
jgi:eukaryotic-like serine/threonine-protein kinase